MLRFGSLHNTSRTRGPGSQDRTTMFVTITDR